MLNFYAILLSLLYTINSKVYVMYFSKLLQTKCKRVTYNLLTLLLATIIIIKQLSKVILHNSALLYAMSTLMLISLFLVVMVFYSGTFKKKIFVLGSLLATSVFLDLIASLTSTLILHIPIEQISQLTLGNVLTTSIGVILTLVAYMILSKRYKGNLDYLSSLHESNEITILTTFILVIFIPTIVITNSISILETHMKAIIQFSVIALIVLFSMLAIYRKDINIFKADMKNQALIKEMEYYNNIIDTVQELHKLRHDVNNHFATITSLMNLGEYETVKDYLNKLCDDVEKTRNVSLLDDKLLSIILTEKFRKADSLGIKVYRSIMASEWFYKFMEQMQDTDKTALFSNLLDNAIRAASESDAKKLSFEVKASDKEIRIICSNSKPEGTLRTNSKGLIKTTKKELGHGLGMEIIQDTTWKYGGSIDYRVQTDMFITDISFYKRTRKGTIG